MDKSQSLPGGSAPTTPLTSAERVNTISHFHRAEIARMAGWRDRLDRTTNWALTVAAAMLSLSLSTPTSHHGVLLFGMLLVLLLLWIEARRYCFYDVYRHRVRQFERHYFAQIFSPQDDFASNWLLLMGESLRSPKFLISRMTAFARRLRRNYIYIFAILLVGWAVKISTPNLQADEAPGGPAHPLRETLANAALGPLPGWIVIVTVAIFYAGLAVTAYMLTDEDEELAYGNVHV
jgi:uncharacterized membrane protein